MTKKLILFLMLWLIADAAFSQPSESALLARLQEGILLYRDGNFGAVVEALLPVRDSPSKALAGESLFWTALAELSMGNYEKTVNDIETLEALDPASLRIMESRYHKGRALFYLDRYDEAIVSLKAYSDSFTADTALAGENDAKKAAALYWIGESLFAMGQMERAADVFFSLTTDYPQSAKYEASSYRIALINQKKVEAELLSLLKWSHEESLRIMEEYQRRERAYDQAILSYQKRINDMLKDTRLADLETANTQYQQQLAASEERIRSLEARLEEAASITAAQDARNDSLERLRVLRSRAEALQGEMTGSPDDNGSIR